MSAEQEPPSIPAEAAQGQRIGKYIRTEKLGAGGMGEVWKAWDTELRRWVALKFLLHEDPTELARLRREAQTSAKLVHPNIAAIYETHDTYLAMQLIEGRTLDGFPRGNRRIAAEIIRQAALAVHFAHGQGVIHRDLKPANIMVLDGGSKTRGRSSVQSPDSTPSLHVYVMDFGLAKTMNVETSLSSSGVVVGTSCYMPPEQAMGESKKIDARSDVYALGATLYHLISGRPPFDGETFYDLAIKLINEEPPSLRKSNPEIERDLETIVFKCLEKDRRRRYDTAEALADDLQRWLSGEPIFAHPPSTFYRIGVRIRKERKFSLAVGGILAILIAAVIFVPGMVRARRAAERRTEAAKDIDEARRLYESGNFAECLARARHAQELAPEMPGGWYWEARNVIHDYAKYQRLPTPWVVDGMIEFLPAPAEPEAARVLHERAVSLVGRTTSVAPQGLEGWEEPGATGILLVLQGRYEEGEKKLAASLRDKRAQWDVEAKHYLALGKYYRRRFSEAAAVDKAVLHSGAGVELVVRALHGQALQEAMSGRSPRALEHFEQALGLASMHPEPRRGKLLKASLLLSRADLRIRIGRRAEAQADIERSRAAADDAGDSRETRFQHAEASLALAILFEKLGKRDDAIPLAQEAVADFGEALKRDDRFGAAFLRRGAAHAFLARSLPTSEETEKERLAAVADIERYGRDAPGPYAPLALVDLSEGPLSGRSFGERLAAIEELIRKYPNYPPLPLKLGEFIQAEAQIAWETRNEDPTSYYEKALDGYRRALDTNAEFAEAFLDRALAYAAWGDYLLLHGQDPSEKYSETFDDCGRALNINPELYEAYLRRADKRLSLGVYHANTGKDPEPDWRAAIDDYSKSIAINAEYYDAYFNRGMIRMNLGDICERSGREPFDQYDQGLADCEEGARKTPMGQKFIKERAYLLLRRGFAYARRGQSSEARADLEKCVAEFSHLLPADLKHERPSTTLNEMLLARGQALCVLGRHEEARKDFEECLRRHYEAARPLLESCQKH